MKSDIIGGIQKTIKYGNRSNMGFHYGQNVEIKNSKGISTCIKQLSVDFNGTKEVTKIKKLI